MTAFPAASAALMPSAFALELAINQAMSLLDVFDAHGQSMCDLYAALFDPETDYFSADVVRQFEVMDSDSLILDYVILNPQ